MKIFYIAGREASYSRTRIVQRALQEQGHEVVPCFPPDKAFKHYPRLLLQAFLKARSCDLVLVGFYGQLLVPFVKLLTWKPMLFDMYITTHDTMVFDREKAKPGSLKARLYGFSDWLSYKVADLSILDSNHAIQQFGNIVKTDLGKFRRLFLAVDDTAIHPKPQLQARDHFLVHFHGEYIPFHGVRHILQAAKLLENENVRFQIVGRGATYEADMALARELGLNKVRFLDPVPYAKLADYMAEADVCLGIFGNNARADLVLTNKVIEAIGMGKPLITRRNQPVQELLQDGVSVRLVEPANPRQIADAILELKNDEAHRLDMAAKGHQIFLAHNTAEQLGVGFEAILQEIVKRRGLRV
jgi:glycosyltransferase involved in cell wall biosynthesis